MKKTASEKKEEIINVVMKCFQDTSYKAISIRDICKRGNITIGTFYNYFTSKEELLRTILLKYDDYLTNEIVPTLTCVSEKDNLYIFTDSFALDSVNNTAMCGCVVSNSGIPLPHTEEDIKAERNRPLYKIPEEIIRRGQAKKEFSNNYSSEYLTEKLITILRGVSVEWSRRNYTFDVREYTKEITDLFIHMIER